MHKRILIIVLILCFFIAAYFSLSYCGRINNFVFSNIINPYNPLEVKALQPINKELSTNEGWEDPRGLFPIFAYNLPDRTNNLTASLKIIERGGINIVLNSNMGWIDDANKVKKAFENLKSSNLKWIALVENECKDDFIFRNANNETNSNIKKYLDEFNDDFIYGWYLWDEPGNNRKPCTLLNFVPNSDNADINRMSKQIRSDSAYTKKLDFVNLFPTYWDYTPSTEAYEKYIDAFISSQEFKPRVLCFDHYPLLKNEYGGFRKDYFSNLDIIRKKSIQYNIPFWMIVLSSEHDYYKKPTIEEISLQVYSALAYGARGIGYYLYSKGWEQFGYKSWILENYVDDQNVADSLHGPLFVPVQELNQNIQMLGKILLNLKSTEIIHTSDYPNKQREIEKSILSKNVKSNLIDNIFERGTTEVNSKILVGAFRNVDKSDSVANYLLIVNKDVHSEANIEVTLIKYFNVFYIDKNSGEMKSMDSNNTINVDIQPGTGELFYLK